MNQDFIKYEKLKQELTMIQQLCPRQYFAVNKCDGTNCSKLHVEECFYPCIHYFTGNCKYSFNCHYSHNIKRKIPRPEPQKETCRKLYYDNYCPAGGKCKYSHDLKQYPCYFNTLTKCKFGSDDCRYCHDKLLDAPLVCFFDLMKGCNKNPQECTNTHMTENVTKYLSYDGL